MKIYKLKLCVLSPLVTPIMGDTLFGHICWGILYEEGDSALKSFLELYDSGSPPLIISDGFPTGKLPRPLLESHLPSSKDLEEIQHEKKLKKKGFIPASWFFDSDMTFNEEVIRSKIKDELEKEGEFAEKSKVIYEVTRLHNTIDRITGLVREEGGLYSVDEIWYENGRNVFDVYVLTTETKERILKLFSWGLAGGYGADKSTGKGKIKVCDISDIQELEFTRDGDRAMSLGSFVPAKDEKLLNLRANIRTKFGKLGGYFASAGNPFKKPIVMYSAGATFDKVDKPYVGCLLNNVHTNPDIRHHALAPIITFKESKP